MHDLLDELGPRRIEMHGANVSLHPSPDLGVDPTRLFEVLKRDVPWEQRSIRTPRGPVPQPRLVSWHGDADYSYSGIRMTVNPWTPVLSALRERIEAISGARFNSVLLNAYRGGRDSIGMHADDEPELGPRPFIASVSLGSERVFEMRRKDGTGRTVRIPLTHGSLLTMSGDTQRNWLHGISKTREPVGERINLTFRLTGTR